MYAPTVVSIVTRLQHYALPFALILLCGGRLSAQSLVSTLKGHVYDTSGAVLPGATIALMNSRTGELRTTKADNKGEYSLEGLKPGKYELRVEGSGFQPDVRVTWIPSRPELNLDSVLRPAWTHGYGDAIVIDVERHRIIGDSPEYRGAICGHVLSQYGDRIPRVRVVAENLDTHGSQSSEAGKDGAFVIDGLPKGFYRVSADIDGYWPDFRSARIEYAIDPEIELQLEHR
jgi:hypothetical protein